MANVNIPDLTALTAPATTDVIEVYDDSAAQNKSLALSYLARADGNGPQITGGGTIALAGYTLTVPATGTAALLGTANLFTTLQTIRQGTASYGSGTSIQRADAAQKIDFVTDGSINGILATGKNTTIGTYDSTILSLVTNNTQAIRVATNQHVQIGTTTDSAQLAIKAGSASTVGLVVDTAASPTANAQEWYSNGTLFARLYASGRAVLELATVDNGATLGPTLLVNRNSNASTPASGNLAITNKNGTTYYLWVDGTGDLRIGTSIPNNGNDLSGAVVGSQS